MAKALAMKAFNQVCLLLLLACLLSSGAHSQPDIETWLKTWNQDEGRDRPLMENDVLFRTTESGTLGTLTSVGFRQSTGVYTFGKLIIGGRDYSPLEGMLKVLNQSGFLEASDEDRLALFSELLQATHGQLGCHLYRGTKQSSEDRPNPPASARGADDSHRFLVWFAEEPGMRSGPEWRQVLYSIDRAGERLTARTLQSYHPNSERLTGFPDLPGPASE